MKKEIIICDKCKKETSKWVEVHMYPEAKENWMNISDIAMFKCVLHFCPDCMNKFAGNEVE